jgi:TM2 domain-containing membrane protein YozV
MKKIKIFLCLGVAIMLVFTSCTMQKRVYTSGYSIQWHNSNPTTVKQNVNNDDPKKIDNIKSATALNTIKQTENNESNILASNSQIENNSNTTITNENIVASANEDPQIYTSQTTSPWYNNTSNPKLNTNTDKKTVVKQSSTNSAQEDQATKSTGKSWIATLLLCIFLGTLGIHRFYLGYTWQGIVQLLTLGGFGIWVLIDFIRIIIRDLQPKNGHYTD